MASELKRGEELYLAKVTVVINDKKFWIILEINTDITKLIKIF